MTSRSGGEVEATLRCPSGSATCHSWSTCSAYGPTEQQGGDGTCSGWAANGDGTVTCAAGRDASPGLASLLGWLDGVGCSSSTYVALGLDAVTVLLVSPDPYVQEGSFSWRPATGCVHTPPVCHPHGVGNDGFICGIGPGFEFVGH
ncbi:MAG: hypothetical protein QOI63_1890 [Thermoplasmata archaeon]|jgi:hypothetical protein|nr:hypothetical protein [Thermoplasmata archaeon]